VKSKKFTELIKKLCKILKLKSRECLIFFILIIISLLSILNQAIINYFERDIFKIISKVPNTILTFFIFFICDFLLIYLSTKGLEKLIEKFCPLEEGIDPNTREDNICLRANSLFYILEELDKDNIPKVAEKIGKEFAEKSNIVNVEDEYAFLKKWKKTDVEVANFFKDIRLNPEDKEKTQWILKFIEPFWLRTRELKEKIKSKSYENPHNVCLFFKYYAKAIIESYFGSKNIKSFKLDCENGCYEDKCCYKLTIRK